MRFPFESHADLLLSFIRLSVPLAAFISLSTRAYSAVFSSALQAVTGGCHGPIGIHFIFPSALFAEQTCIRHFSPGNSLARFALA